MIDILGNLTQQLVDGRLWQTEDARVLALGDDLRLNGTVLLQNPILLRFAIPMLGPSHLSVIPAIFVAERGAMLYAWQAWNFIMSNYQLYPRAEILGLQNDGETVQVFMRELDFGAKVRVLAYRTPEERQALAQVSHLLATVSVPNLLTTYLSPYTS